MEQSLRNLRTDFFDLYRLHAVSTSADVEQIFAAGGAMETFLEARDEGKIRHIGFSAHSVKAAMLLMDRFDFDPGEALTGLRFALSHPVTLAIPPGNEDLFKMALRILRVFEPLNPEELENIKRQASLGSPLFRYGDAG